ncbi:MAG: LuxR C-terminal-related transcriptional regulator [Ginsengibacter sp.]|jgi:DNA-binding CsgD family transcriptional regulator
MSFKYGILTVREIEISGYLKEKKSLREIEQKTGLSKKILTAHLRNMMKKLRVNDPEDILQMIRSLNI